MKAAPTGTPSPPQSPSSPRSATVAPRPSKGVDAEARRAASALFERFRSTGPYYDAEEDGRLRTEYYRDIDWNAAPAALAAALTRRLTDGHDITIPYAYARDKYLYPSVDLHEDGLLHTIYSDIPLDPVEAIARDLALVRPLAEARGIELAGADFEALLDDDALWEQIEAEAGAQFDCEHVVCQAWFKNEQGPMTADLHHLFACEKRCNNFRGKIPYWQFPVEEVMADCGRREGGTKFEPKLGKGAVSRATMYFLLRYPGKVGDKPGELTRERLGILLDWHRAFPVTVYERHRNWLIAKAQGNRNPFIDRPEAATEALLADCFGGVSVD